MNCLFGVSDAARIPLPDRSVDLVFGSPPYLDCRTYGIEAQRNCREWIHWMLAITTEACRVAKGLVLWVCAGAVRQYCYQPGPEGLLYEWWKRGGMAWRPCYWNRSGIPGSGGQHWLRADVEYVLAFVGPNRRPRRGRPAQHSNGLDFGISRTVKKGQDGRTIPKVSRRSKSPTPEDRGELAPGDPNAFWVDNTAMGHEPKYAPGGDPTHRCVDGARSNYGPYAPPVLANPGNLIETNAGYGTLGNNLAHENEAPFPEKLAEFFIRTACPPGGLVLDPFSGSGTTVAVAERCDRNGIGLDIRQSQAKLAIRRLTRPHSPRQRSPQPKDQCLPLFD